MGCVDQGCVLLSRSPSAAEDVLSDHSLQLVSSAAKKLDRKADSCPTDNMVSANFALVHVMGISFSLS